SASTRRAARSTREDARPRLALADWLAERCWAEEAAYYRSEFSAAAWRLELAVRDLLKLVFLRLRRYTCSPRGSTRRRGGYVKRASNVSAGDRRASPAHPHPRSHHRQRARR